MKYGFHVFLTVTLSLAVSALPVIEIRTTDTDGGPTTRLKLLALPILREIAIPEATLYYMTPHYSHGCSPSDRQSGVVSTPVTTTPDNAEAQKTEDNQKGNEIPSVTLYV